MKIGGEGKLVRLNVVMGDVDTDNGLVGSVGDNEVCGGEGGMGVREERARDTIGLLVLFFCMRRRSLALGVSLDCGLVRVSLWWSCSRLI